MISCFSRRPLFPKAAAARLVVILSCLLYEGVHGFFSYRQYNWRHHRVPWSALRAGDSSEMPLEGGKIPPPTPPSAAAAAAGSPTQVLILMDGFCPYHGGYLEASAKSDFGKDDVLVIPMLSNYLCDYLQSIQAEEETEEWEAMRVPSSRGDEQTEKLLQQLKDKTVVAIYCESDSGLADAEAFRQRLVEWGIPNVLCDDPVQLEARRNKYLMQQVVQHKTGLPTVQQRLCHSLAEAQDFARDLLQAKHHQPFVVVKPYRGVASESVSLCSTLENVSEAWDRITSSSVFGSQDRHDTVLVQEYLAGVEYAVDVVSRNGHHKIAAIWRYDKRPANGAAFCYFKTELVDRTTDPAVDGVCSYVQQSLTALGVKWGFSHTEVIVTPDRGPMLVEVNCRQHNMDFAPLTMICVGYNALDMTLQAFFGSVNWDQFYPDTPTLRVHGCMVHLVNYAAGHLTAVNYLDELEDLESVLCWHVYDDFKVPGTLVKPTIDIRSDAGWIQLVNEIPAQLQNDYETIVGWMPSMFQASSSELEEY